jgi:hypothetical protein
VDRLRGRGSLKPLFVRTGGELRGSGLEEQDALCTAEGTDADLEAMLHYILGAGWAAGGAQARGRKRSTRRFSLEKESPR